MSLELTIMPLTARSRLVGNVLGYNRLGFKQDYRIFAQIADIKGKSVVPDEKLEAIVRTFPLPQGVKVEMYEDEGITPCDDPSGEYLVYTTAAEMRKLVLPKDASPQNKAILAYVKVLPRDTPIVLEWHY